MKCAMTILRTTRTNEFTATYRGCYRAYCTAKEEDKQEFKSHPYRRIHPWRSEIEFADSLLKNVIYNKDGIIAINKPYGVSIINRYENKPGDLPARSSHAVVAITNYSLELVLPYLVKKLGVSSMIPCTGAEKYMSGVYIFGVTKKITEEIQQAQVRSNQTQNFKKYWAITTRVPNVLKGHYNLAMKLEISPHGSKKPVIITHWSNNAEKKQDVKILNIKYKLISNSTNNLSSLIELDVSTRKWHSIRLFASTMLYSPVLGDNYHGSRVQEFMGTWVKINPFTEACDDPPVINKQMLELLNIKASQQEIIPCHIHLRSVFLKSYGKQKKDILIEAPLSHPFDWTCKQLMFKNIPYEMDTTSTSVEDKVETINANACIANT